MVKNYLSTLVIILQALSYSDFSDSKPSHIMDIGDIIVRSSYFMTLGAACISKITKSKHITNQ